MKCARCDNAEFRYDDFCSIYCRDMAEVEAERDTLRAEVDRLWAAMNKMTPKLPPHRRADEVSS